MGTQPAQILVYRKSHARSRQCRGILERIQQRAVPIKQDALAEYSRVRTQVGAAIVQHARHLGAYMQAQLKNEVDREMAERYRTPDAVMRETAVPARF